MVLLRSVRVLMVLCLILASVSAIAQEGRRFQGPDVVIFLSPTKEVQLDAMQKITVLPEWELFFDKLTSTIDREYTKKSGEFPFHHETAKKLFAKIKEATGKETVSSKDVMDLFFSEIDLIQFEFYAKRFYDDFGTDNPIKGKETEYMRLTAVTKFNPQELRFVLDGLKEGEHYTIISSDDNSFLMSVTSPHDGVKLYIGCQKIESLDLYAVVFSGSQIMVEQKLAQTRNERFQRGILGENAPADSIRLGRGAFEVVKKLVQVKIDAGEARKDEIDSVKILGQIDLLNLVTRDVEGETVTRIELRVADAETANNLKKIAEGGLSFLKLARFSENVDENSRLFLDFVTTATLEQNENTVVARISFSNEQFYKLMARVLKEAAANIK